MVTLVDAVQAVREWCKRRLYKDDALIEVADAIQYGGVKITIVAGKITDIEPYLGVKLQDKVTQPIN